MSRNKEIPIWEKYTLSIEEAALYFRIGENKLGQKMSNALHEKVIQIQKILWYSVSKAMPRFLERSKNEQRKEM